MSKLIWKRRLGNICAPFYRSMNRRVVLLYHSVGDGSLAVSEEQFRQQTRWLMEWAKIVPFNELVKDHVSQGLQVSITFDDGYSSLHDRAAPILAEYEAAATVYLNSGWIGETDRKASDATLGHYDKEQFLLWKEVDALHKAGWTIGSHGVNHLDLTDQESSVIEAELANSRREIEAHLDCSCEHFAYTWGRFNPALQRTVRSAGYLSAVSGLHGPIGPDSDPYALPRIDVRAEYELSDFQALVMGHWDYIGLKQHLMRKFV